MTYMLKSFIKHTSKFILYSSGLFFLTSCSLFQNKSISTVENKQDQFIQVAQLVEEKNFDQAILQIEKALVADPLKKSEYLFFLARSYDQTAQPEKALLSLKELSDANQLGFEESVKHLSLMLKNQSKVGVRPDLNLEKGKLQRVIQQKLHEDNNFEILSSLMWSLDFQCDLYCVQEIQYFQEIQSLLVILLEKQEKKSQLISKLIQDKYKFFQKSANSNPIDVQFKKAILAQTLESIKALSRLQIITPTPSSLKTAQLIQKLKYLEKQIEQEMYK